MKLTYLRHKLHHLEAILRMYWKIRKQTSPQLHSDWCALYISVIIHVIFCGQIFTSSCQLNVCLTSWRGTYSSYTEDMLLDERYSVMEVLSVVQLLPFGVFTVNGAFPKHYIQRHLNVNLRLVSIIERFLRYVQFNKFVIL